MFRKLQVPGFYGLKSTATLQKTKGPPKYRLGKALLLGEPAGTRTQDTRIKSPVLYHLSYGLISSVTWLAYHICPFRHKPHLVASMHTDTHTRQLRELVFGI